MTAHVTVWIALAGWPIVAMILYKKYTLPVALIGTLLGGYLVLPRLIEIDLPVLPPINKNTVPVFCAFIMVILAAQRQTAAQFLLPGWLPRDKMAVFFIGLMIIGAFGSMLTNLDGVRSGGRWLQGMRIYDGFSLALRVLVLILPLLIARKALSSAKDLRTLAILFVMSAVAYGFLALWEVRMSPQLNRQLYGFFAHSWVQHVRAGGFRPIVFLEHGLLVGIYMSCAMLTAVGMIRSETGRMRQFMIAASLWLIVVIFFSKVLGALMIALLLAPVLLFLSLRLQLLVVLGLSFTVMSYPILRAVDLVPTQAVVQWAEGVDPARAESLEFRIRNEDRLLDRAKERPVFGWGGWARDRVYDENGEDITVTDGRWIILFAQGGWVRYIGEFGLLLLAGVRLAFMPRSRINPVMLALSVALMANLIDLLPNAGQSVITWMIAGAMIGRLERGTEVVDEEDRSDPAAGTEPLSRYSRNLGPRKVRELPSSRHARQVNRVGRTKDLRT